VISDKELEEKLDAYYTFTRLFGMSYLTEAGLVYFNLLKGEQARRIQKRSAARGCDLCDDRGCIDCSDEVYNRVQAAIGQERRDRSRELAFQTDGDRPELGWDRQS
jgi:hypothetical protein